ncbi:MAG: hypothetical protein KC496_06535, partial [Anaerolineae bacterium]|nr:hypothetical protein [Anaerolineae bacterium]
MSMRFPIWLTILAAVIGLALMLAIGSLFLQPNQPLILDAAFDDPQITPNADGENDITTFSYELSRNAQVTIVFEGSDGTTYAFRENEERIAREYAVQFSGVVDGYTLPDETIPGIVERRLLPNDTYTWRLIAENETEREETSGTLTIADADVPLPIMTSFTLGNDVFTPNQDGVTDRVVINIYLEKEADLRVYLQTEDGQQYPIAERTVDTANEEAGRHIFDYAGGVDRGQDPPPDGDYKVVAIAQDAEGQRTRRESELTITLGGKPRAEIAPQFVDADVFYLSMRYEDRFFSEADIQGDLISLPEYPETINVNTISVPQGDLLVFRLTVNNYSNVPIRTTGPAPGTVYQQGQLASSLDALEEPGAWRVGIQCD